MFDSVWVFRYLSSDDAVPFGCQLFADVVCHGLGCSYFNSPRHWWSCVWLQLPSCQVVFLSSCLGRLSLCLFFFIGGEVSRLLFRSSGGFIALAGLWSIDPSLRHLPVLAGALDIVLCGRLGAVVPSTTLPVSLIDLAQSFSRPFRGFSSAVVGMVWCGSQCSCWTVFRGCSGSVFVSSSLRECSLFS